MTHPEQTPSPTPGRRDPEGRRAAILRAAAELICESGVHGLTHRAVAARAGVAVGSTTRYFTTINDLRAEALRTLADDNERDLAGIADLIRDADLTDISSPATRQVIADCADVLHGFLSNTRQVHATLVMLGTATTDAPLRTVALQWSDQLSDLLAAQVGTVRATAAVAYIDGVTVHAALHDTPVSRPALAAALTAIIGMPPTQEDQ
ncbi:HTH-type transcriptional regulator RcdA [Corynebacterium provencense]|uniref:HTH-type transcriptional regulator RcdA n=1 Tax=Corynebacterium provencense TaxID=1737425 RepID=A0A2Z3YM84_9CORY|nr:TetR family transcriptional regulator [Corynebacterium provencense]AWT25026.1 HTH-type transcriptional regulator RcdA [Corynebacterium provencense]